MLDQNETRALILLTQWIFVLSLYSKYSRLEKTYLNILTPFIVIFSVKYYLLDIWGIFRNTPWGSDEAFLKTTITNTLDATAFLYGASISRNRLAITLFKRNSNNYWVESIFFIFLAIASFFPIYKEFGSLVFTNPRMVYTQTRTGWGLSYFTSALFIYLSLLFSIFSVKQNLKNAFLIAFTYSAILFIFGSKGKIVGVLTIVFFWYVYFKKPKVSSTTIMIALLLSVPSAAIIINAFTTRDDNNLTFMEKLDFSTRYADYNKNQAMVIDDPTTEISYGKMIFEDYVISKIPRTIYPEKPKDFGEFALAKKYYSSWFHEDSGSPRFGNAKFFIDFGVFAMLIIPTLSLMLGLMVGSIWNGLKERINPYNFSVFCIINGVVFLQVGAGSFTLETIALISALYATRFRALPKINFYRTSA